MGLQTATAGRRQAGMRRWQRRGVGYSTPLPVMAPTLPRKLLPRLAKGSRGAYCAGDGARGGEVGLWLARSNHAPPH